MRSALGLAFVAACAAARLAPIGPPMHLKTIDSFYPKAEELRDVFDERFAEPRQAHSMRFVWDCECR